MIEADTSCLAFVVAVGDTHAGIFGRKPPPKRIQAIYTLPRCGLVGLLSTAMCSFVLNPFRLSSGLLYAHLFRPFDVATAIFVEAPFVLLQR